MCRGGSSCRDVDSKNVRVKQERQVDRRSLISSAIGPFGASQSKAYRSSWIRIDPSEQRADQSDRAKRMLSTMTNHSKPYTHSVAIIPQPNGPRGFSGIRDPERSM